MWRWRTLVRQLCVGPSAHGLIGTHQVSPRRNIFYDRIIIIICHTIFITALLLTLKLIKFCFNTSLDVVLK